MLMLTRHEQAGTVTVAAEGEIDVATIGDLERAVAAALGDVAPGGLVLADLTRVRLLDSAGIGTLLKCRRIADAADRRFRVAGATGLVLDVLRLTGVAGHLCEEPA